MDKQEPLKENSFKPPTDEKGAFVRPASTFRDFISSEPGAKYPPEADRYHIYVNLACPWATGVLAMLELKGLTKFFTISTTKPEWGIVNEEGRGGWIFDEQSKTSRFEAIDHVFGQKSIYDVYRHVVPGSEGKKTVPILLDKKTKTIVNNESIEIMKMLNSEFENLAEKKVDLYPKHLQAVIDENYDWIYNTINNGVYKSGFAVTQEAYDEAVTALFASLDRVDKMLEG